MRSSTGFVKSGIMLSAVVLLTMMCFPAVRAGGFDAGDKVEVYHTAGKGLLLFDAPCGNEMGRKLDGAGGMVLEGPVFCSDRNRWRIRWEDGLEGWSVEDYLKRKDFPTSRKFSMNDKVEVCNIDIYGLRVRTDPPELKEKGNVYEGNTGVIEDGSFYGVAEGSAGFYAFWKIKYDNGMVGWSAEPWLKGVPGPNVEIQPEKEDEALRSFTELPDLKVDGIWIEPAAFGPGETVDLFVSIENTGSGDAVSHAGLCIKGYFDGSECYEATMEGLGAGAHTGDALHRPYTWPSDTDQHTIRVEVDPDNYIPESDENNNDLSSLYAAKIEVDPSKYIPASDERNNDLSSPFPALNTTIWALFCFLGLGLLGMGYLWLISSKMRRIAKRIEGLEEHMAHLETLLLGRGGKGEEEGVAGSPT